jgi:uncharacterized protein YqeY
MNLVEKIKNDVTVSMKNGEKDKKVMLKLLVSSLEKEKINQKLKDVTDLKDEDVVNVLQKQMKLLEQERESLIVAKKEQSRLDLIDLQKSVVKEYLPEQLGEDEITKYINNKKIELNIDFVNQKGKLMGILSKELKGKADLGLVSKLVNQLLK